MGLTDITNYDPNSYSTYLANYGMSPVSTGKKNFTDYSAGDNWVSNSIANSDPTHWVAAALGQNWSLAQALGGASGMGSQNDQMKFSNFAPGSTNALGVSGSATQLKNSTGLDVANLPSNVQQEVYNSMSPQELQTIGSQGPTQQQNFIAQRLLDIQSGKATANYVDPASQKIISAQDAAQAAQTANQQAQTDALNKVNAFAAQMQQPLDPNDPQMQAMMNPIRQGATLGGLNSGLGSGWAGRLGDQAVIQAGAQLQSQRSATALSALEGGAQDANSIAQMGQQSIQFNQTLAAQIAQQQAASNQMQYQNQMGANQGLGSLAGTVLGYYVGGPAGAAIGSKVGAGFGGATTPQPQGYVYGTGMVPSYQYSSPSSTSSKSGLSGGVG